VSHAPFLGISGNRLFAVIVRRVAVDGVDMQHIVALVRELYVQRWPRYAVVDGSPFVVGPLQAK
jgi:hypothetical protein